MSTPLQTPSTNTPPLRNGDHLTRDEFERRYDAMPEVKKAELIEGVVHMPSPVNFESHSEPHACVMGCLMIYRFNTPGVRVGDNPTIRLDMKNEPQPDAVMLIDPIHGGRVTFTNGYVTDGPEFAAEVAASSVSIDANSKLRAYQRNGVQEYLLWRVEDGVIQWFALHEGHYLPLEPDAEGVIRSEVFPGFWLDPAAMLHEDFERVQQVLNAGLTSNEHKAFVAIHRQQKHK